MPIFDSFMAVRQYVGSREEALPKSTFSGKDRILMAATALVTRPPSFSAALETLSKVSAVAASMTFILGVAALWGKSFGLYGIPFYYVTVTDVLNSALSTLPIIFLVICFAVPFSIAAATVTLPLVELLVNTIILRDRFIKNILKAIVMFLTLWLPILLLLIITLFLSTDHQMNLWVPVFFLLSANLFLRAVIKYRNTYGVILGTSPCLVLLVFSVSLSDMQHRLVSIQKDEVADRSANICTDTCALGFILVKMSEVTIIVDKSSKEIAIIPNSEIKRITDTRPFELAANVSYAITSDWARAKFDRLWYIFSP